MAAAVVFSCQKNTEIPTTEEPQLRTFTCTIADAAPDPESKVSFTKEGSKMKTKWEVGDKILIHGAYTNSPHAETVTLAAGNISADGKTATFTLGEITGYSRSGYSSTLYAQYPADAVPTSNHCYWNSRFSDSNLPLMIGYNKDNTFVLHNICGILAFTVSGDFDSYVLLGKNGETVGYSALQSRIRLTTSNTEDTDGFPIRTGTNDSYTTTPVATVSGTVVCDGTTPNRIYIPGGVSFSGGFIIRFIKKGLIVKQVSTSDDVSIGVGDYFDLGDISGHLKNYAIPNAEKTSAVELSDPKSANCYVVDGSDVSNANKVFKFPAVKGNTYVKGSEAGTSVGTVAGVVVVWETWNNAQKVVPTSVIKNVDFEAGFVYFKMPSTLHAGNALIAAKDADGKVLWSWHIWVPSSSLSSDTYGIHATKQMMDRNLGALDTPNKDVANPENAGLFYQWGRKDPLRTISAFDTGTLATTCPADVWTTSSTQLTTDNMEASPCVFIINNTDWLSTRENTLWANDKQIHDPCPIGYKVPKQGYTNFFEYFTIADYAGWSFNEANYNFTIGETADPVAVFPFGHITRYGAYDLSDSKAWVWTATYKTDNEENARAVTVASESSSSCSGQRKANGVYVRCVAE